MESVNLQERVKFAKALTSKGNEGRLLRFMDTEKGKAIFDSFVKNKCTASISGILNPLTGNAAEVVEKFHDKLFDLQRNPTPELRNMLNLGITLPNLSAILSKARARAPEAFEKLYNVLFDNEGRNTPKLELMLHAGITLNDVKAILFQTEIHAAGVFNTFYDILFHDNGDYKPLLKHILDGNIAVKDIVLIKKKGKEPFSAELLQEFIGILYDDRGNPTPKLQHMLNSGLSIRHITQMIGGAGKEAVRAFHKLYDVLFDAEGDPTPKLQCMLSYGLNVSNVAVILNGAGRNVAEVFNRLYHMLFDAEGDPTPKLQHFIDGGLTLSNVLTVINGSVLRIEAIFDSVHDVLFTREGNPTPELDHFLRLDFNLVSLFRILKASRKNFLLTFREFHDSLFNDKGDPTPKLQHFIDGDVTLSFLCSLIGTAGGKAVEAFNKLHDVLFDDRGDSKPELQHFIDQGLTISNISSMIGGAGIKAAEAFKELYDVLFDNRGKPKPELQHMLNNGFNMSRISSIISGSKVKSALVFKKLHDALFDDEGDPTPELKHFIDNDMDFNCLSGMLTGTGVNAAEAFKKLHDALFDGTGETSLELQHFINSRITLSNVSSVIGGAGLGVQKVFKKFHDVLFDDIGKPKPELQHILDSEMRLPSIFSMLSQSRAKAPEAFKKLHDVLFDDIGKPKPELQHFIDQDLTISNISGMLNSTGIKAAEIFKKFHDVLFDAKGTPTPELQHILDSEMSLSFVSSVIGKVGERAPEIFKKFHDVLFDDKGNPTPELQHILDSEISLPSMSSIISKAGVRAPEIFKKFHDVLFDAKGTPTPELQHILKEKLSMSSISVVLKGSGVRAPEIFKKFHDVLFDNRGKPKPELQHILDSDVSFSTFCNVLFEARTPEAFKKFHDVLFDAEGDPTPELQHILDCGLSLSSVLSTINGSGIRAAEAFKKFHDVLFDAKGTPTPELQHILSSKLVVNNVLGILTRSGIRAAETFKKLHDVLFDAEGDPTPKLLSVLSGKMSFSYISSALSGSGAKAVKKFKEFHGVLFGDRGKPTPELQHILDSKIDLSSISNITNGSKERAAEIFKEFHDVLFDAEGDPTPELQHILDCGLRFSNISCVLSQTGEKAAEAFKEFHDVLFDAEGTPTPELQHILDSRISLSSVSGIINGSKVNAPKVFKKLHDVLFDAEGNPTPELQHMLGDKVSFPTVFSMIPSRIGEEAPKVFKKLHDVLFDAEGNPTPELQHILNSGISLASVSSIIRKSGTKVPETFKALHDVLFDAEGNPTPELQHILDMNISFSFLSSVLVSSGTKAPEIFKEFHDVLFDDKGNPTPELQHILDSKIDLSSLSTIISKARRKAPEAFKKLHDVLFDAKGTPTPELQHILDSGIRITSIFRILAQSGINYARVFKKFHDVLFDDKGNPTPELQHILDSKIDFGGISRALSGSGVAIAEAFKKFHDVLFDAKGTPTPELQHILDSKISFSTLLKGLANAGANATLEFKKLHDVLFDDKGNPTPELQHILDSELTLDNFFSILADAGTNIAEVFKRLHDDFFDCYGELTTHLQHMLAQQMDPDNISAILHAAGSDVKECFYSLYDTLLDSAGTPLPSLQAMLNNGITMDDISNILSGEGKQIPEVFKELSNVLLDDKGNPTPELQHILNSKIDFGSISRALSGSGVGIAEAFKKFHDVLFDAKGNPTPELQHILNSKIDFGSISRALSGSGVGIAEAFKKFHDVLFDDRGKPKPELQYILDKKISFAEVCSVLSKTGVEAPECFKELCGFWFGPQGEKVDDGYIASIFNLERIGDNSLFNFGKNIASIYKVLSRWPVEVLTSRNVQYLADKLIESGKKFSKDFEFQEIVSIFSGLVRLCKTNQELAISSHVTFNADVYRSFASDLLNQSIKLAPEQHDIKHIINMIYNLSALVHSNLVITKSHLHILINSLVGCLSNCELDDIYSDKNCLHISFIITCLDMLVDLVYREKETPVDKGLTGSIINLLSNINSFQSNISASSNILLVLSKISRSAGEKAEANFLVRAIGKVLDKLKYIQQCSDQDLPSEISSTVGQLSDRLKNLLHSAWFLDHLLSNMPLSNREKLLKSIERDGLAGASESRRLITDNILIDEDQSEKYTLTQFKEKCKKEGKVKYEEGVESYVQYDHRALDLNYEFNIEKNHSQIMIAKVAYLVDRAGYGVFLATNESIAPKTFLGTYVGTRMEDNKEVNQHVPERDSTVSIVSEKGRNWASYMHHVSTGNSNVRCISKRIGRHAHLTLSTSREILPGHQLLCDHVQDFSCKLGYISIYPHYTDNYESPAQRYNRAKDFYYNCVIDLDKEITRDLGYHGSKHFVVTKLFKQIYDKHNSQEEYASGSKVLSLEGLDVPIYAVTFRDKKWSLDRYDRQQQITSLMFACYLGQEDTIKLLLEKKDDCTRQSLHTGNNALFFTVLSNKTSSETKKRILDLLINHLEGAEQVNSNKKQVVSFRSRILCTTDSFGYNLFDHLINRGEYSLYQGLYRKLNPEWQRKVARKFMIDRGVFSMVLTLGEEAYIKIINLLLKNISIKFIKEHFESLKRKYIDHKKTFERLLVNNRDEKLNNLRKLTNLNKYIKKEIEILLGQEYREILSHPSLEEPNIRPGPEHTPEEPNIRLDPEHILEEPNIRPGPEHTPEEPNIRPGPEHILEEPNIRLDPEHILEGQVVDLLKNMEKVQDEADKYHKNNQSKKGESKIIFGLREKQLSEMSLGYIKDLIEKIKTRYKLNEKSKKIILQILLWSSLKDQDTSGLKEVLSQASILNFDQEILSSFKCYSIWLAIDYANHEGISLILDKMNSTSLRQMMENGILYSLVLGESSSSFATLDFLLGKAKNYYPDDRRFLVQAIRATVYSHDKPYEGRSWNGRSAFNFLIEKTTSDLREVIFQSIPGSYQSVLQCLYNPNIRPGPEHTPEEPNIRLDPEHILEEPNIRPGPEHTPEEPNIRLDPEHILEEPNIRPGPEHTPEEPNIRLDPEHILEEPNIRPGPEHTPEEPNIRPGPEHILEEPNIRLDPEHILEGQVVDLLKNMEKVQDEADKYHKNNQSKKGESKIIFGLREKQLSEMSLGYIKDLIEKIKTRYKLNEKSKKIILQILLWSSLKDQDTSGLKEVLSQASILNFDQEILSSFKCYSIWLAIDYANHEGISLILDKMNSTSLRQMMENGILYSLVLGESSSSFATLDFLLGKAKNYYPDDRRFLVQAIRATVYSHDKPYEGRSWNGRSAFNFLIEKTTSDLREVIFQSIPGSYQSVLQCLYNPNIRPGPEHTPEEPNIRLDPEHILEEPNIRPGPEHTPEEPNIRLDPEHILEEPNIRPGPEHTPEEPNIRLDPEHILEEPNIRPGPEHTPEEPNIRPGPEHILEEPNIRLDPEHILEGQVVDLLKNMEKVQDEADKYHKNNQSKKGESKIIFGLREKQLSEMSLGYIKDLIEKIKTRYKLNEKSKKIILQILLWSSLKDQDTSGLKEVLSQASILNFDQEILSSFKCYSIWLAIDYANHEGISLILDKMNSTSLRQMMENGILYSLVLGESSSSFATLDFLLGKAKNYYPDDRRFLVQAIRATVYSHDKPYEGRSWNGRSAFNFLIEKTTSDLREVIFQSIPGSYQSVLQCLYNPNIRPGPEHTPEEPNIRLDPEHILEEPNIRPGPEHTPEEPNIRLDPEHILEEPNIRPGPEHILEEPNIRLDPEHILEGQVVDLLKNMEKVQDEADKYHKNNQSKKGESKIIFGLREKQLSEMSLGYIKDLIEKIKTRYKLNEKSKKIILQILLWSSLKDQDTSGLKEVLSQASILNFDQEILSSFKCYSIWLAIDYANHEGISLILDKMNSTSLRQMMENGILYSLVLGESSSSFATLDFLLGKAKNYYPDDRRFLVQAIRATVYSHDKPYEGRSWNGRSAFNFLIEKTTSDLREVIFQSIPGSYQSVLQCLYNPNIRPGPEHTPEEPNIRPGPEHILEEPNIRLDPEHILEGQVVDLLKNMEKVQDEADKYHKNNQSKKGESKIIFGLREKQLSEMSLGYIKDLIEKIKTRYKLNEKSKKIILQILLWSSLKDQDTSGLKEVLSQASILNFDQEILSSFKCYSIWLAIDYANHEGISLILDKMNSTSLRQMMENGILYSLVLGESSSSFATLDFLLGKAKNYYPDDRRFLVQAIRATVYSHDKPYEGRSWNGRSAFNFLIEKTTSDLREVIFQSIPGSYQSVLQCLYNPNIRPGPEHTPEEPNIRLDPEHILEEPNIRPGPEHTPEEPNIRLDPEHILEEPNIRPGPEHTPEEPNIRPGPEHILEEPNIRLDPEHILEEPNIRLDPEHILEGQVVDLLKNMEKVQDEADKYHKNNQSKKGESKIIFGLREKQLSEMSLGYIKDLIEKIKTRYKLNEKSKKIILQILLWSSLKDQDTSGLKEVLSQASILNFDQEILSSFKCYSIWLAIDYANHEGISLILDKMNSTSLRQMMENGILYSLVLGESSSSFATLDFLLGKAKNYYPDDRRFLVQAIRATVYSHDKPYEGRSWNGRSAFNFLIEKTTSDLREVIFQSIPGSYQSVLQCLYNPNIRPGPEHTPEEPNIRLDPEHILEEPNIRPGPEHTPEEPNIRLDPEHILEEPNIRPGPEHTPEEPNIRPGPEHILEEPNIRLDPEHILEGQVVDLLKNMEKVQDEADKYHKNNQSKKGESKIIFGLREKQLSEMSLGYIKDLIEKIKTRYKLNEKSKKIILQILLWSSLKDQDTSGLKEVLSQASILNFDQEILSSFKCYSIWLAIDYANHEGISLILDKMNSTSLRQMMENGILYSLVLGESSSSFATLDFLLGKAKNYYPDDRRFLVQAIRATVYSHDKPYEGRSWNGRSAFNFLIEKTTSDLREVIFQSIPGSYQSVLQCLYNPNIRPGPEHTPEEPNIRLDPEHILEEPNIRPGPEHTPEEPNIRLDPEHILEEPNIRPGPEHTPEEPNIRPGPEHILEEPNIRLDPEHILEGQVVDLLKNMEKVQDEADKYHKNNQSKKGESKIIFGLREKQLSEMSLGYIKDLIEKIKTRYKLNEKSKKIILQILLWSSLKDQDTSGLKEVLSQASILNFDQEILSSFKCYSIWLAIDYANHEGISLILDKMNSTSLRQMMENGILYSLVLGESSSSFATLDFLLGKAKNYYPDDRRFLVQAIRATVYSHDKPYEGRSWNGRSAFNFLIEKTTSDLREVIFQSIPGSYQSVLQCLYNPNIRPGPEHTPEEPNIRLDPEHILEEPNIRPGPEHTPEEPNIRLDPEHILEEPDVDRGLLAKHFPDEQKDEQKFKKLLYVMRPSDPSSLLHQPLAQRRIGRESNILEK